MDNNQRFKIVESCLENKLSVDEANQALINAGLSPFETGERDCYKVLTNSTASYTNPRKKIIATSLMRGLSKTEANLALYDGKFRRLTAEESEEYEDILSRIRYCGKSFSLYENNNVNSIPSQTEIINDSIEHELNIEQVNSVLNSYGYQELTTEQILDYRQKYNIFHNKRQGIIQHAYQELKSVQEINILLIENNLSVLSMVEEMNYIRERENIVFKKRENLINECIEEHLEIYQINIILNKNKFEKLSEQEEEKINAERYHSNNNKTKKKTSELTDQFRKLYRHATKEFHPDKFNEPKDRLLATTIMKELNDAKDKNDYFLLKEIVQKYEKSFLNTAK